MLDPDTGRTLNKLIRPCISDTVLLSEYRRGISKVSQLYAQDIRQLGRRGLSELVRPLLAILCNSHQDRSLRMPMDAAVHDLPKIIDYLFRASTGGVPYKLPVHVEWFGDPRVSVYYGSHCWYHCEVRTGSSKFRYHGQKLFENSHYSAAFGFLSEGNFETARAEIQKGLAINTTEEMDKLMWLTLPAIYRAEGDFKAAISVYEQALIERPAWFRLDCRFWSEWYETYKVHDDLDGAIKRFTKALTMREGNCFTHLCKAQINSGWDLETAMASLNVLLEPLVEEYNAEEWESLGLTYEIVFRKPALAAECYEKALVNKDDTRHYLFVLINMYVKSRDDDFINANTFTEEYDFWTSYGLLNYVDLCHKYGRCNEAIKIMEQSKTWRNRDNFLWKLLAATYTLQGNGDKAKSTYLEGLDAGIEFDDHFVKWLFDQPTKMEV